MKILLSKLKAVENERPHGYIADCLSSGSIDGEYIEFPGDTYWQLKAKYSKPRGLGDSITSVMQATGISQIVNLISGGGCGCGKRQDKLNELVPYKE